MVMIIKHLVKKKKKNTQQEELSSIMDEPSKAHNTFTNPQEDSIHLHEEHREEEEAEEEDSNKSGGPHHAQLEELASTIDPSHIIHLIRQLLPVRTSLNHECELAQPSGTGPQNGPPAADDENDVKQEECDDVERSGIPEERGNHQCKKGMADGSGEFVDHASVSQVNENGAHSSQDLEGLRGVSEGHVASELGEEIETGDPEPRGEEELREEAGCVLWDLAASETQADFLVDNHILDVLLAILVQPQSDRMREICLGILGNLACHSKPEKAMVAVEGLVQTVIQQLQFDDPLSLSEVCRLLSAGLHSDAASSWVVALNDDQVLERTMWMAANTMNPQLREKSTELLLAMVDSKREAISVLLPSLVRLGLLELLTDLVEGEVIAISEGNCSSGDAVLDIVLQVAEALSLSDEFAAQLASNQKLFALVCQVIRLADRDEIGPSGITGIVLIANLLTEMSSLVHEFSQDGAVVERLLGLLPMASDDPGARNALWSVLDRLCQQSLARTSEVPQVSVVAALAVGANLLLDDLDDHREEDEQEDEEKVPAGDNAPAIPSCGRQSKLSTVAKIAQVMEEWLVVQVRSDTDGSDVLLSVQTAFQLLGNFSASPDSVMQEQRVLYFSSN